MQAEIQSQAHEEMSRSQREYFLREQLRAIQTELGDGDAAREEMEEYRAKIEEAGCPTRRWPRRTRQLRRLEQMHPDGPEAHVLRTYLDWMIELPWSRSSPDRLDLARARRRSSTRTTRTSRDIKDRILEYLGVRKLRGDSHGPILCFVGPPGVGKTSLGRSIARAMGREFVRISLGGVRDEAEIRGHRRTYVGALPGRIIQGLKQAGTNNPVFMLDEIDKLGADFRGDPSAALLEVLDPEQNHHFSDHYLNVPFDLSKVLFIATANLLETIPRPAARPHGGDPDPRLHAGGEARDRALVPDPAPDPRARARRRTRIRWSRGACSSSSPTTRARRACASSSAASPRSAARSRAAPPRATRSGARVNRAHARPRCSARRRYLRDEPHRAGEVGRRERPRLDRERRRGAHASRRRMTRGQRPRADRPARRRDEGVGAGGADVRARARRRARLRRRDVRAPRDPRARAGGRDPEGRPVGGRRDRHRDRVARDARSPVRSDVAMTGEVTLRGQVLPVGGVREKALAALRAGIARVILPRKNLQDLREIPQRPEAADHVRPGRPHGRGARRRARARARRRRRGRRAARAARPRRARSRPPKPR